MDRPLQERRPWRLPEKLLFRFVFLFFLLFIIVFNNGAYPFFEYVLEGIQALLHRFVPWAGRHILHLHDDITVFTNGSGDTTYDYVCLLLILVLAVAGCLVWTLADRRARSYDRLYYWLTVAVRFYVGLMLISYGLLKLFKFQFPSPGAGRLAQPYGSSSPMGLAWTFLGFSKAYNIFMGVAEVAAVLLLFRRTVAIGAVICLMTTLNVMAVNYCYDVPVKIVSTALVTFTLFLLAPNFRRLYLLFFRGRATELKIIGPPPVRKKWLRYTWHGVRALVGVYLLFTVYQFYDMSRAYGDNAPRPPLYGVYNVTSFRYPGRPDTALPELGRDLRWRQLVVEWPDYARARLVADTSYSYTFRPDTVKHEIVVGPAEDSLQQSLLHYALQGRQLTLQGRLLRDSVEIRLQRFDDFRLTTRGFHWINEYPFNR